MPALAKYVEQMHTQWLKVSVWIESQTQNSIKCMIVVVLMRSCLSKERKKFCANMGHTVCRCVAQFHPLACNNSWQFVMENAILLLNLFAYDLTNVHIRLCHTMDDIVHVDVHLNIPFTCISRHITLFMRLEYSFFVFSRHQKHKIRSALAKQDDKPKWECQSLDTAGLTTAFALNTTESWLKCNVPYLNIVDR